MKWKWGPRKVLSEKNGAYFWDRKEDKYRNMREQKKLVKVNNL